MKNITEEKYLHLFKLHCQGKTAKEIAVEYHSSIPTIGYAWFVLRQKFGASNNAQLALILKEKQLL